MCQRIQAYFLQHQEKSAQVDFFAVCPSKRSGAGFNMGQEWITYLDK